MSLPTKHSNAGDEGAEEKRVYDEVRMPQYDEAL